MNICLERKFDLTEDYNENVPEYALQRLSLEFFLDERIFECFRQLLLKINAHKNYCLEHVRFAFDDNIFEAVVPLETIFPEIPLLITKLVMKGEDFDIELKRYCPYLRSFETRYLEHQCNFRTGRDGPEFLGDDRFGLIGNLRLNGENLQRIEKEKDLEAVDRFFSEFYELCTGKMIPKVYN